ncbi:MAG: hypothetical protein HY320_00470 [Armatimonadetes bacterium]|nr:hypothetical protein [Armatimonadota bacterium]
MQNLGASFTERDLGKQPFSEAELRQLIGRRSPLEFLNPRHEVYRQRRMKESPPTSDEAICLMAAHTNLIRRPLLIAPSGEVVFGYDEEAYRRLAGATRR